jgi:hypothetical protein
MRHATLRSEFLLQLLERLGSDKLGGDPKARLALEAAGMPFPQVRCAISECIDTTSRMVCFCRAAAEI